MVAPSPSPEKGEQQDSRLKNPGGTRGGAMEFFIGLAMLIGGVYLFLDNVVVMGNLSSLWGFSSFGLTLIPIFAGVAMLFFNGKNVFGWILTCGGLLIIVLGVLARLTIFYKPQSLFHTIIMLVLAGGGVGLIARGLRAH
jgi:uncharacterized protein